MADNEQIKQLEILAQGSFAQRMSNTAIICMTVIMCVFFICFASLGGYIAYNAFEFMDNRVYEVVEEYEVYEDVLSAGDGTIINDTNISNSEVNTNGNEEN